MSYLKFLEQIWSTKNPNYAYKASTQSTINITVSADETDQTKLYLERLKKDCLNSPYKPTINYKIEGTNVSITTTLWGFYDSLSNILESETYSNGRKRTTKEASISLPSDASENSKNPRKRRNHKKVVKFESDQYQLRDTTETISIKPSDSVVSSTHVTISSSSSDRTPTSTEITSSQNEEIKKTPINQLQPSVSAVEDLDINISASSLEKDSDEDTDLTERADDPNITLSNGADYSSTNPKPTIDTEYPANTPTIPTQIVTNIKSSFRTDSTLDLSYVASSSTFIWPYGNNRTLTLDIDNNRKGRYGLFKSQREDNETFKSLLKNVVSQDHDLGDAIGEGDCFFDAVAQALNQRENTQSYTVKSLRLLIDEYIKDPKNVWVKDAVEKDRDNYQDYVARVQFTAAEMRKMERDKFLIGTATWGRPNIEGKILCEKLGINIHVIECREKQKNDSNETIHEAILAHELITKDRAQTIEENKVDYSDKNVIHIVVNSNHFVPILRKSGLQESYPEEIDTSINAQGNSSSDNYVKPHTSASSAKKVTKRLTWASSSKPDSRPAFNIDNGTPTNLSSSISAPISGGIGHGFTATNMPIYPLRFSYPTPSLTATPYGVYPQAQLQPFLTPFSTPIHPAMYLMPPMTPQDFYYLNYQLFSQQQFYNNLRFFQPPLSSPSITPYLPSDQSKETQTYKP